MAAPADTLNPLAILAALGVPSPTSVAPVPGGTASTIWRVAHGARVSALRVVRPEQAPLLRRELAAMQAAREAGVPVPAVQAHGCGDGRPAVLLDWVPGMPLGQVLRRAPWRAVPLGRAFGRMQARIHRVVPHDPRLDEADDWVGWQGELDPRLQGALDRLRTQRPVLLHLDYHPMNVMTDGRAITGVLDWANARVGDPRADVARTYAVLMVEPNVPGRQPLLLSLVRRLLTVSWRRGYVEVGGPLAAMPWFYVWAGEVMARDLAPRVRDPDSWWEARHLAQIRAWGGRWRERAERAPGERHDDAM